MGHQTKYNKVLKKNSKKRTNEIDQWITNQFKMVSTGIQISTPLCKARVCVNINCKME